MINQDIIHLLNQRARLINKYVNEALQQYNLYHAQWSILYYLYHHGPRTQKEIMNYYLVNAPTITRTVKRMEENGWIDRVPGNDRRERYIDLTEEARKMYSTINKTVAEQEAKILAKLSAEEKEMLFQLLKKIE